MSERITTRCSRCQGRGEGCKLCIGRGVLWSDGRPMTSCPGGRANPPSWARPGLACGRRGAQCPGCDRDTDIIGLDEDVRRDVDALRRA